MKKVAVIGVGLMGGSLGLALKRLNINNKKQYEIIGIGRNIERLKRAKNKKAVDKISTDISEVSQADIVFICGPVNTVVDTYKAVAKYAKTGAVVADVGSVKFEIESKINALRKRNKNFPAFVGCHPMAGKENNGVDFADKDLYKNATVVITSPKQNEETKVIEKIWKSVGAVPVFISAKKHDEYAAFTSHLPHIIAYAFYKMFKEKAGRNKDIKNLTAGSFGSITRVAKSSPEMWLPIFLSNKKNLKNLTESFCKEIKLFADSFNNEKKLKEILSKSVKNEDK